MCSVVNQITLVEATHTLDSGAEPIMADRACVGPASSDEGGW